MDHATLERNTALLIVLITVAVAFGGMVELFPMVFEPPTVKPGDGVRPLGALELEGRDIYIREGCTVCHTQMVRPLRAETERYGAYSVAGEDAYEHPFLWGSKRTGPDLARVGGRYSDEWHRVHLRDPRSVVPASNMPGYPWLAENVLDGEGTADKMRALALIGVPYTDADIGAASEAVAGRTELEAVIAYLQQLRASPGSTR
ncbi:MAG: cytochrome-c oxidase, cbb3-type subunit II [Gammaproteobacteria bacterium]|jgi:cytochrome c oxidase cbb3-type subunit 2